MGAVLRQLVFLFFANQILAIWWLFPHHYASASTGMHPPVRRWSISSDINSGISQSPIDISDFTEANCPQINYQLNYDSTTPARLENTGTTVKITMQRQRPTLSGGPLTGEYLLQEVHFHWSEDDDEGAEHTRNGIRYPMETHVVHYKSNYSSFQEALKHKDGVAVIGIVFDILPYRNSSFRTYDNAMMLALTSHLKDIPTQNSSVQLNAEDLLKWFWPFVNKDHYFTYSGSLTTPPYAEVVTWIVYDAIIPISEQQMEEFREISEGEYREVHPRNGRIIYYCDMESTHKATF